MLKLWGRTNSLNAQKVFWTLAELGLRYELIQAGLQFGVVGTPEYKAMNPNSLVPTIDDDGFVLWESNAIVRYLCHRHAQGTLFPADERTRFSAERWMDWQTTTLAAPMGPVFFHLVRLPQEKRDPAVVQNGRKPCEQAMAVLDAALAGRDYLEGKAFTMADIPAATSAARWSKLPMEREKRPNVERWLDRLREREGFRTYIDQPLS